MSSELLTRAQLADNRLVRELAFEIGREVEGRCIIDEPLAKHTSWRIGGPARLYVYPASPAALSALIQFCRAKGLPTFTIGYGTNLLVADEGFAGCVMDLVEAARGISVKGNQLRAGGGAWLGEVVRLAAEHGLGGMEKLAGIPGGVGGGLSMNAGAFGMAVSDHLTELDVVTADGEQLTISEADVGFSYRSAPGLVGKSVFEARFQLPPARKEEIIRAVEETITERFRRNVMTLPSAGSVFKNPPGVFAATLIEAVGGKGLGLGGVEVSKLHANFIVNARGGTANDILKLIRRLRRLVRDRFDLTLELEVRTLGFEGGPDLEGLKRNEES